MIKTLVSKNRAFFFFGKFLQAGCFRQVCTVGMAPVKLKAKKTAKNQRQTFGTVLALFDELGRPSSTPFVKVIFRSNNRLSLGAISGSLSALLASASSRGRKLLAWLTGTLSGLRSASADPLRLAFAAAASLELRLTDCRLRFRNRLADDRVFTKVFAAFRWERGLADGLAVDGAADEDSDSTCNT